jgi:hypothetical protein
MNTVQEYREKAAQARRLADSILDLASGENSSLTTLRPRPVPAGSLVVKKKLEYALQKLPEPVSVYCDEIAHRVVVGFA